MTQPLNDNQKAFALEYIRTWNATQSYKKVYDCDQNNAEKHAVRLVDHGGVQEMVNDHFQAVQDRHKALFDRVVNELSYLAFSRAGHFASFNDEGLEFKSLEDLEDYQEAAIHSIESRTTTDDQGNTIRDHKYKLHDKIKALDLLGKHLGMYRETKEDAGKTINVFNGLTIINSNNPPKEGTQVIENNEGRFLEGAPEKGV